MSAIPADSSNKWKYHEPYNDSIRLDMAGWKDDFYDTDLLFEMVLKAIVAKVFTVIDAYRLFNRPTVDRRNYYSLHPLRVILGGSQSESTTGGDTGVVKIIPDAIEFYYRLILLAEYYREKFGFTGNKEPNGDDWRLSMVPSIDGTWSDFIEIIFDKAEYVKEGNYTESQVHKMIKSMNDIWKSYKSKNPSYTTINMLNAYVLEMNKVFGFIKQKEIDSYLNERRQYLNESPDYNIKEDFIDYDILDANSQFGSKPAPSDKFVNTQLKNNKKQTRNMIFLQEKIENIRKSMDADFVNLTKNNQDLQYSFYDSLRNYKLELKNSKSDADAYKTVVRMLQGANKYINISGDKLIMLHEAVVAPLSVLYGVYKVIAKYNAVLHGCSLKNIEKWNAALLADGNIKDSVFKVRESYMHTINNQYSKTKNKYTKELFIRALLGYNNYETYFQNAHLAGYIGFLNKDLPIGVNEQLNNADIDFNNMFTSLLKNIIEISTGPNKLVQCNISSNGNINIDFSELEELCVTTLNLVKNNINILRSSFEPKKPNSIIDKYEDSTIIGSVRWLEENLIEILLKDRDECGINRGHSEHLKYTFDKLLNSNDIREFQIPSSDAIVPTSPKYGTLIFSIRSLILHDASSVNPESNALSASSRECDFKTYPFNVIQPIREVSRTELKELYEGKMNAINKLMPVPCMLFETPDNQSNLVNTYNFALNGQSLMFAFNRILQMYLYTNTDDNSLKFYAPLIENFATGAASLEVLQKKAYPNALSMVDDIGTPENTYDNNEPGYLLGIPESPASLVFASSAATIRSMLATVITLSSAQKKRFMYDNLLEIPEYMKDRMKTNLPIFSKMLNQLYEKAAMLKMFLNNTNLKNVIPSMRIGVESTIENVLERQIAPNSGSVNLINSEEYTTEQNFSYYTTCLTKLMDLSNSLRKCADAVYKELQDKPSYFMEISKDFLNDYSNRFGGLPLMPASHLLAPLRCCEGNPFEWSSTDISHILMPVKENGSNIFKYNYATRLVLSQSVEVGLEHLPGAKEIYNNYASVSKNNLISPQQYAETIKKMIKLSKFLIDGLVYNRLYNTLNGNILHYSTIVNRYNGRSLINTDDTINSVVIYKMLDRTSENLPSVTNKCNGEYNNASIFNTLQMHDTNKLPGELYNIGHEGISHIINSYNIMKERFTADQTAAFIKLLKKICDNGSELTAAELNEISNGANALRDAMSIRPSFMTDIIDEEIKRIDNNMTYANLENVVNISKIYRDDPTTFSNGDTRGKNNMSPFQLSCVMGLTDIIELTEGNNLLSNKEKLANCLGTSTNSIKNEDRNNMRLYNILDMNIVPINVHAFMREIPFVNLLNYSYTFDRLVHEFILPQYITNKLSSGNITSDNIMIKATNAATSTRELMVKLLTNPYAKITGNEYFDKVSSLFNGNDNLRLGRPRYLSDQLWHKVLITSSADFVDDQESSEGFYDVGTLESGPSGYESMRKGRTVNYNEISGKYNPKINDIMMTVYNANELPVATSGLKIYKNGKWTVVNTNRVHNANMHPADVLYCAELGKLRFDTKLVRNLTWLVNLQRIMRVIMVTHLSQINTPVVRGLKIANPKITEFDGNEKFEEGDYDGTNYDLV